MPSRPGKGGHSAHHPPPPPPHRTSTSKRVRPARGHLSIISYRNTAIHSHPDRRFQAPTRAGGHGHAPHPPPRRRARKQRSPSLPPVPIGPLLRSAVAGWSAAGLGAYTALSSSRERMRSRGLRAASPHPAGPLTTSRGDTCPSRRVRATHHISGDTCITSCAHGQTKTHGM